MARKTKVRHPTSEMDGESLDYFSSGLEVGGTDGQRLVFFDRQSRKLIYGGPTLQEFLAHPRTRILSRTEAMRVGMYDYDRYMLSREAAPEGESFEMLAVAPPG